MRKGDVIVDADVHCSWWRSNVKSGPDKSDYGDTVVVYGMVAMMMLVLLPLCQFWRAHKLADLQKSKNYIFLHGNEHFWPVIS